MILTFTPTVIVTNEEIDIAHEILADVVESITNRPLFKRSFVAKDHPELLAFACDVKALDHNEISERLMKRLYRTSFDNRWNEPEAPSSVHIRAILVALNIVRRWAE